MHADGRVHSVVPPSLNGCKARIHFLVEVKVRNFWLEILTLHSGIQFMEAQSVSGPPTESCSIEQLLGNHWMHTLSRCPHQLWLCSLFASYLSGILTPLSREHILFFEII